MKKSLFLLFFFIPFMLLAQQQNRIESLKNQLESLKVDNPGLSEQAKIDINVNNISLANFILAISNAHDVNINIAPELNQTTIANNNFSDVTVSDLLVFLCKEYDLTIDFTGSILSIKQYLEPIEVPKEPEIPVAYSPENNTISIDAKNNNLYIVFKRITDESAKNLVFTPGLENKVLTAYVKDMPFDTAMNTLALANNLYVEKTKDGFYLFEDNTIDSVSINNSRTNRGQTLPYTILDVENKLLKVDFKNTPIKSIIYDLGFELNLNIFTASPLDNAGSVTFKAESISFDALLIKIFESQASSLGMENNNNNPLNNQPNQNNRPNVNPNLTANPTEKFTFKKEGNIYFFGT